MNVGGPAVLLTGLSNELAETDIEHYLVTGACRENEEDYLDKHEITTNLIRLPTLVRSPFLIQDIRTLFQLIKIMSKIKPNIVHTHTSKAGVLGRLAVILSFRKCKIVHTYHGHLLYGYFPPIMKYAIIVTERILAKFTDQLIAVSEQIKIDLLEVRVGTIRKWKVIYPGVELPEAGRLLISKFDNMQSFFEIIWVGRFTDIKNPILAIKAFQLLPNYIRDNARLTMVGDGELLNDCKKYAEESCLPVVFTGNLPDIDSTISRSHLLLITSRNEGFPLVMLEAAARLTVVIATNVGGIRDFITEPKYGFLCEESAADICSLMTHALNDNLDLAEVAKNAYHKVVNKFSDQEYFRNHYDLYKLM